MDLTGLKSRCWQAHGRSGGSRGELLLFFHRPTSRDYIPWFVVGQLWPLLPWSQLFWLSCLPLSLLRTLWPHWAHLDTLVSQNPKLIPPVKFLGHARLHTHRFWGLVHGHLGGGALYFLSQHVIKWWTKGWQGRLNQDKTISPICLIFGSYLRVHCHDSAKDSFLSCFKSDLFWIFLYLT